MPGETLCVYFCDMFIILILKPRSKSEVCQLDFTLIINTDPCIFEIDIVMN